MRQRLGLRACWLGLVELDKVTKWQRRRKWIQSSWILGSMIVARMTRGRGWRWRLGTERDLEAQPRTREYHLW